MGKRRFLYFIPLANIAVMVILLFKSIRELTVKRYIHLAACFMIPGLIAAVISAAIEPRIESETVAMIFSTILYSYCLPLTVCLGLEKCDMMNS